MALVLETRRLGKSFGGLAAVQDLDLQVSAGEIRAVIGPNGAGKSTLLNLLSGIHRPTQGDVQLDGASIVGFKPHQIARRGVGRTFQAIRLFRGLTVRQTVMTAQVCRSSANLADVILGTSSARREQMQMRENALRFLDFVGLADKAELPADSLPYGQQKLLELARALATEPRVLLLDEPAAGMNRGETTELMQRISAIRDRGITVLLVEHNMRLVMDISDRITVMDFGQKIAEGAPDAIRNDSRVIEAYLGSKGNDSRTAKR